MEAGSLFGEESDAGQEEELKGVEVRAETSDEVAVVEAVSATGSGLEIES
ncbi:MAG: hypothetical protein OP8BY_0014 [Candidatus Saccharicenans subterraneus]|uniref:Uncharacterized protein n=1 Tax=Candidatus Saccharicenans subterraneus TaxID=2508984 RepID=A0A3E2BLK2_9BACT|nr:MAG: hypothetical protein OP8BY_0014 [Candidatus Saccharicenans subterraneum]